MALLDVRLRGSRALRVPGKAGELSTRLALNDQTPQLELIQPLDGAGTHRDWLAAGRTGPQAERAGYEVVQRGSGLGPKCDGAWAYIDTSEALGLMIEAVEPPTGLPPIEFTWPNRGAVR